MKITKDFKLIDKNKGIGYGIVAFISISGLAMGIATSFGTMDEDMSRIFYRAMDSSFMRGFDAGTIMDGYIVILTWGFPLAVLLVECTFKGCAKVGPHSGGARHQNGIFGLDCVVGVVYAIILFGFAFTTDFKQLGMDGIYNEFIIGHEYVIPIFVVDIVLNYTIFICLAAYIHKVVAMRKDFLELKVGRRLFVNAFFIIFGYVMILALLKATFQRPYGFNIHGNDNTLSTTSPAEKFAAGYPKQYDHYIHGQDSATAYNGGGTDDIYTPQGNPNGGLQARVNSDGKWLQQQGPKDLENGKGGQGGKGGHKFHPNNIPVENAFPSGHMICLASVATNMLFYYDLAPFKSEKKKAKYRGFVVALLVLFELDMAFTLETSTSHGGSDISFSMFLPPIAYFMAEGVVYGTIYGINKHQHTHL